MMKILVISLPGVGNTLLVTPLIELLRQKYPRAYISVLVMFKSTKELLEKNPNINQVILWEFLKKGVVQSIKFLLNLRRKRFDLSILSYPSNRIEYNIVSFIIGAKMRLAHRYTHLFWKNLGFLSTKVIMEEVDKHDVEENISLLSLIGEYPKVWSKPKVYITKEEILFAEEFLTKHGIGTKLLIGMHPGSATFKNQAKRRWEKEKFAELGNKLVEKLGAYILIFGGNEEEDLKSYIKENIGRMAYVVSNTTIRETSALISHCSVFISADSGLMHIAASLNIKCVAIFGPTNPKWVYPYKTNYIIVRKELTCSPCFYYSQRPLRCKYGDFRCIKYITVDEVYEAVMRVLKV